MVPVALVLTLLLGNTASAGLVAHWAFDGDATDSTGNGHDGTEQNGPIYVVGQFKQAIEVDGSSSHMTVPHSDDLSFGPSDAYSVVAWIYPTRLPNSWAGVVTKGRDTGDWYGIWINGGNNWVFGHDGNNQIGSAVVADTWTHVAVTYDNGQKKIYLNGELDNETTSSMNATGTGDIAIGAALGVTEPFPGWIDEVAIFNHSLTPEEVLEAMVLSAKDAKVASNPLPEDAAVDVPRDSVLAWTPGKFAAKHDVYFGINLDDVNDATKASHEYKTTKPLGDESYAPGPLDLGATYYWRIDEVNAPPQQSTVFKGNVWQFTTEPVGYPIADITATASSSAAGEGAENTVNGSGLDADDLHSNESASMWRSEAGGAQPTWIEYQFDRIYKLHQMWVWNYNVELENIVGFGFKDVTIEYSTDGNNWTQLAGVPQFAKAPGADGYAHDTTIDFGGALAKSVKLTANSNHGPFDQSGLSEVRFFYIPGWAREPDPQHGATGVHPDVILSWRPGREAAMHDVYLSTDEQGVIDETVAVTTVTETSYDAGTLELGTTYHWRVDEVNEAEIPTLWGGDIWDFATAEYLVVDDFESYNGLGPSDPESNRVFMMWKDGVGYGTQDNPPYSAGNGTGSIIGHVTPPFVELGIIHDGKQSMPYFYNNTGSTGKANYSEVAVDISALGIGSDWTRAGVKTLALQFYGDPANSAAEQMYVKINGVEVPYDGASNDLTHGIWQPWDIDLSSLAGVDLQNVTELVIGFRDGGGSGVVYFDNIRLNPATEILDSQAPDDAALVAHWDFEGDFTDATGKGHDGLAFGDPAIVNDPLRGQVLEVDGDDRIGVSDAPDLNLGANESLTLMTWVNLDLVDAPGGWMGIVAKGRTELGGGTGYVPELYGFYVSPGNNWHVNSGGVNGDAHAVAGGQWHHLAFVQDGPANEGYFYIDGEVAMTGGTDSCDTTGRPLFIGAAGTDVEASVFEAFKGRIDDVRIYSYALSELEIQYLALAK